MKGNDLRLKYAPSSERDTDWRDDAACLPYDSELFFPVGTTGAAAEQIVTARTICMSCPVIVECLQNALKESVQAGIAGGMTEQERKRHKKELVSGKLGEQAITREVLVEVARQQIENAPTYARGVTPEVIY